MKDIIITEYHTDVEIYRYLSLLQKERFFDRSEGLIKKYKKTIYKGKENILVFLDTYIINNIHVLLFAKRVKMGVIICAVFIININAKFYSYELCSDLYALKHNKENNIIMNKYTPHFFSRYKERQGVDKTGVELIKHFFLKNIIEVDYYKTLLYKDKKQIFSVCNEGIALCNFIQVNCGRIQIKSTYLSNSNLKENQISFVDDIKKLNEEAFLTDTELIKSIKCPSFLNLPIII